MSPSRAAHESIPVIDLGAARDGDAQARRDAARAIAHACEVSGFFITVRHGVARATTEAFTQAGRQLFALGDAEKESLSVREDDPLLRGFGRGGTDAPLTDSVDPSRDAPLPFEKFNVVCSVELSAKSALDPLPALVRSPNKWPRLPGFREAWVRYAREMDALVLDLMRLFALALHLPETWFDDKIDQHTSTLCAIYYPWRADASQIGRVRLSEHADWGSLTVLHRDEDPLALQVRDRSGAWVEVPSVPDSFAVNIGDMMAVWTNDHWVSSRHRVAAPGMQQEPRSRYSFPFFCQPNWNTSLAAIPTCISRGYPPRYPPIASGEYLLQRSRSSSQELLYGKERIEK